MRNGKRGQNPSLRREILAVLSGAQFPPLTRASQASSLQETPHILRLQRGRIRHLGNFYHVYHLSIGTTESQCGIAPCAPICLNAQGWANTDSRKRESAASSPSCPFVRCWTQRRRARPRWRLPSTWNLLHQAWRSGSQKLAPQQGCTEHDEHLSVSDSM